ncbi:MAG TPA: glutamate--tRNA ligase family protein [Actinomycetota bacterium]|jgi:glutamyl-tRNA synthetase
MITTRLAPSPTGSFHVGNARSALLNWVLARQHEGGRFLLRIEDTDAKRHIEESVEGIKAALTWLGLTWDGDIVRQSERRDRHRAAADKLEEAGLAYWADAPLVAREGAPEADAAAETAPGKVLRFKVPPGVTEVDDLVKGHVVFDHEHIEDFVILRSDESPTFILAVTVDDLDMGVTHIVRGEEHLSNVPKQKLLWDALTDVDFPDTAHLPLLLNEQRQKLSKRRDHAALEDFIAMGFIREGIVNYLAILGWSPGNDVEFLTVDEIVQLFRLDRVKGASAFFDVAKMTALNEQHIRAMSPEDFVERSTGFLPEGLDWDAAASLVPLVQERTKVLTEVRSLLEFLTLPDDGVDIDADAWAKASKKVDPARVLKAAVERYESVHWSAQAIHEATLEVCEELDAKLRVVQAPIRLAITGSAFGLPLFDSLEVLGRDRALARLRRASNFSAPAPVADSGPK